MKKRILYLSLTLIWMMVIFLMSAQTAEVSGKESAHITEKILGIFFDNPSQSTMDTVETVIRKLCHFLEYALLSVLLYKTLDSYKVKDKKLIFCVFITILYAISDEIHQYFVPGRACRFFDVFIDSLGALCGYGIAKIFKGKNSQ